MKSAQLPYQKTTIVFPKSEEGVLLGMKKRGFGEGWWNGFGGKLNPGESYKVSARRETTEEVGIRVGRLTLLANLLFYFEDELQVVSRAYLAEFEGEPLETEEMRPQFFPEGLPFDNMWPADRLWVPKALNTTVTLGFIVNFGKDNSLKKIEEIDPGKIEEWF